MTDIYPPGSDAQNTVGVLHYDYNQRNLLITHSTYVSGTGWVLQAEYVYDGNDDRLQQVQPSFQTQQIGSGSLISFSNTPTKSPPPLNPIHHHNLQTKAKVTHIISEPSILHLRHYSTLFPQGGGDCIARGMIDVARPITAATVIRQKPKILSID